ncbi:hypothetical protein L6452_33100 [Arctium lappa]|uniref:Uncharacterized protein n=1 Tax=Arctium lappa TaxID=4217 RepID=A0ACB8Z6S7_ARCLA|nr:hypothetical protein L6452_33100 [Arctium lappa]
MKNRFLETRIPRNKINACGNENPFGKMKKENNLFDFLMIFVVVFLLFLLFLLSVIVNCVSFYFLPWMRAT